MVSAISSITNTSCISIYIESNYFGTTIFCSIFKNVVTKTNLRNYYQNNKNKLWCSCTADYIHRCSLFHHPSQKNIEWNLSLKFVGGGKGLPPPCGAPSKLGVSQTFSKQTNDVCGWVCCVQTQLTIPPSFTEGKKHLSFLLIKYFFFLL